MHHPLKRPSQAILGALLAAGALAAQEPPPASQVVLRVATTDGKPRACTVELALCEEQVAGRGPLRHPPGVKPLRFRAADFVDGAVNLTGLPFGRYLSFVAADDHARACSQPFVVGADPVEVSVALGTGIAATGQIVDEAGKPVAGATVTTDDPNTSPAHPVLAVFAPLFVPRVSRSGATTDAQGRFELPHLAAGDYVIRAGHADWCPLQREQTLDGPDGARRDLGTFVLRPGARVTGRLAGIGRLQYELVLCVLAPTEHGPPKSGAWVGTTYSLPDGTFRFPQRVPPGRYVLSGRLSRDGVPLGAVSSFGAFDAVVEVPAGQDEVAVQRLAMRN